MNAKQVEKKGKQREQRPLLEVELKQMERDWATDSNEGVDGVLAVSNGRHSSPVGANGGSESSCSSSTSGLRSEQEEEGEEEEHSTVCGHNPTHSTRPTSTQHHQQPQEKQPVTLYSLSPANYDESTVDANSNTSAGKAITRIKEQRCEIVPNLVFLAPNFVTETYIFLFNL